MDNFKYTEGKYGFEAEYLPNGGRWIGRDPAVILVMLEHDGCGGEAHLPMAEALRLRDWLTDVINEQIVRSYTTARKDWRTET